MENHYRRSSVIRVSGLKLFSLFLESFRKVHIDTRDFGTFNCTRKKPNQNAISQDGRVVTGRDVSTPRFYISGTKYLSI